jgi:hypothetical protein
MYNIIYIYIYIYIYSFVRSPDPWYALLRANLTAGTLAVTALERCFVCCCPPANATPAAPASNPVCLRRVRAGQVCACVYIVCIVSFRRYVSV